MNIILKRDSMNNHGTINWLPVASRVNQSILCHVFKIISKLFSSYLNGYFTSVMSIHEKNTRFRVKIDSTNNNSNTDLENSKRFCIPKVKGFGIKSFAFNGCTLRNALPQNARDA